MPLAANDQISNGRLKIRIGQAIPHDDLIQTAPVLLQVDHESRDPCVLEIGQVLQPVHVAEVDLAASEQRVEVYVYSVFEDGQSASQVHLILAKGPWIKCRKH